MSSSIFGIKVVPRDQYTTKYLGARGHETYQVFQAIPALEPFYTQWEKEYQPDRIYWFIHDNTWIPITAVAVYLLFIFGYPRLAKRFGIGYISARNAMGAWNLLLAAFSWMGAIRVVPQYLFMLANEGFEVSEPSVIRHSLFVPSSWSFTHLYNDDELCPLTDFPYLLPPSPSPPPRRSV